MQMQMWVTDKKWCDYCVYNDGYTQPLIITRVFRDDAKIEKIKIGVEKAIEIINGIILKVGAKYGQ